MVKPVARKVARNDNVSAPCYHQCINRSRQHAFTIDCR